MLGNDDWLLNLTLGHSPVPTESNEVIFQLSKTTSTIDWYRILENVLINESSFLWFYKIFLKYVYIKT